jgi:hypothetical protein
MAGERDLLWGADATDAQFRTGDDQPDDRFVLLEDTDAGTILLEWDDAAGEFVARGTVNMDGNALDGVSDLTVNTSITDPTGTTYTDLAALGGITYVQSTAPSSPSQGDTWGNPDTGVVKWWDGSAWVSDPPDVDFEALTFSETDVNVTNTNTTVTDGSIELTGSETSGNAIISWTDSMPPADLAAWDAVWYQETLDGETVTVDAVEDPTFVDDFEDGDISGWTGDTGALSAQQSTVLTDDWTGELSSSNSNNVVSSPSVGVSTQKLSFVVQIDGQSANSSEYVFFQPRDSGGSTLEQLYFRDGGPIEWGFDGTELLASWSVDTRYEVEIFGQYPTNTVDVDINGTTVGSGLSLSTTVDGWSDVRIANYTGETAQTRSAFIDNFNTLYPTISTDIRDGSDISSHPAKTSVRARANLSRADTANDPSFDSVTVTGVR